MPQLDAPRGHTLRTNINTLRGLTVRGFLKTPFVSEAEWLTFPVLRPGRNVKRPTWLEPDRALTLLTGRAGTTSIA